MTSTPTQQQCIALLKHLTGGKSLDDVALILNLPRDTLKDVATKYGWPDNDRMEWSIDELVKGAERVTLPAARVVPPPQPARFVTTPEPVAQKPDELRILLNTAKGHPSKRIQTAADRVFDQIDRLKALLREDQEKHAERRKAEAEKAAARAEVERLERQLAEAKAKLRGKPVPAAKAAPVRAAEKSGETYACRNEGCDKSYDSPQGRSLHERLRCEHRTEAS